MSEQSTFLYADLSSTLSMNDETRLVDIKYDLDAIKQSIERLISTIVGEEIRSGMGSTLLRLLHKPMTQDTANDMRYELNKLIQDNEPRVTTSSITVEIDYDTQRYKCMMAFYAPDLAQSLYINKTIKSYGV